MQAIGDESPVSGDLQVGDKLIEVNGQSVTGIIEYTEQLEQVSADEDIVLTVIRDAQKTTIIVER